MAFRVGGEPEPLPVKLAGLEAKAPSPGEVVRAFEQRVGRGGARGRGAQARWGTSAFVVDLPIDREELWPASSAPARRRRTCAS